MIVHAQSVLTTDRLREIVHSHDADFLYTALRSDLNLFSGRCSPWHWHQHFEFAVVDSGVMELQTRRNRALLQAGDAYFLNTNVLHLCRAADDAALVRLHVHLFDRSIVASSGLVARRYVAPVENAATFEARIFSAQNARDRVLIDALSAAFAAAETDAPGWEMEVQSHLFQAWRGLYCCSAAEIRDAGEDSREDILRTKAMLSFIHSHYDQPITVDQIARAAGICERECFRCFARVLDTTPKAYLSQYRISMVVRLLSETGDSITEIAYLCGFANSSYFGKVFRQVLGCSPRDFRRK